MSSTAGNLSISALGLTGNGPLSATGNVALNGTSGISLGALTSGGTTSLAAANGAISATDLRSTGAVTASGRSIDIASGAGLSLASATATAGNLSIATALGLTATGALSGTGNVSLNGAGGLTAGTVNSGGTTSLAAANGAISVTDLRSIGAVTASGRSIDITSGAGLSFASATATAGNLSLATALGLTATGALSASGNVSLSGASGLTVGTVTSGGTTGLAATSGAIAAGDLQSAGLVTATGQSVGIASSGGLAFNSATATAGDLAITTQQDLTIGTASASGAASFASVVGGVHVTGNVTAANIDLRAGGDITLDGVLAATSQFAANAGGTFVLGGVARGRTMSVSSRDIDIASGASLGARGVTQDLTLSNGVANSQTYIGGGAQTGHYSLDNAEAQRLFADRSITINGALDPTPTGPETFIGALQMSFGTGGNLGPGGTLQVMTPGWVEVNGAVNLTTVSADDTFLIDPLQIDVVAGEGSIAMKSASGTVQGTLNFDAGSIMVADRATLAAIGGATGMAQISQLLNIPAAAGPAGGYLQAGSISLTGQNAIFVQNGGPSVAYADRAGFTANQLFLNTGSASTRISVNGVILQAGSPVGGLATEPLVTINDVPAAAGGLFDPLSTINGCVIGVDCRLMVIDGGKIGNPTSDDLTDPLQPPDGSLTGEVLLGELFQMGDNNPLITPPLVDEPITGVGNDDLWFSTCASDNRDCAKKEGGSE